MQLTKISYRTIRAIFFAAPLCLLSTNVLAESWSCRSSNNVREVHIERTIPGEYVPCNVVYKKLTEGAEDQILWNAQNDDSYCEEKAEGLVEKLGAGGWVCSETINDNTTEY